MANKNPEKSYKFPPSNVLLYVVNLQCVITAVAFACACFLTSYLLQTLPLWIDFHLPFPTLYHPTTSLAMLL